VFDFIDVVVAEGEPRSAPLHRFWADGLQARAGIHPRAAIMKIYRTLACVPLALALVALPACDKKEDDKKADDKKATDKKTDENKAADKAADAKVEPAADAKAEPAAPEDKADEGEDEPE
jgi:hypothetical protein